MEITKIGFIGLGLIGGSIAKSIKKNYKDIKLYALASRQSTIDMAYADALIENDTLIGIDEIAKCDIIFLCSPVGINISYLKELKPLISESTLITDVGSVKGDITKAVNELGLQKQFIGGHPMTGAEKIGYQFSNDYLLTNAYYILTSSDDFDKNTLDEFEDFIKKLGPITLKMSSRDHDHATAAISHMPHVVSAALVNTIMESDDPNETMKTIAAGGFKDITRISSSSPVMWQHICQSNTQEIISLIDAYELRLNNFKNALCENDFDKIFALFSQAKEYRDNITVAAKADVFDIYTEIADACGTLSVCLDLLANNNISIKNLDIIHNRESEPGVLHLVFYTKEAMEAAIKILNDNNYPTEKVEE